MRLVAIFAGYLLMGTIAPAMEEATCPNNTNAIGTSRIIVVDPVTLPRIGSMQYKTTLPLQDHEVVLTFDDGPLPPYTNQILDTLAANCVKANYFLIGQMAQAYPDLVRRIYNAGHVIGTHSQSHPLTFNHMAEPRIAREVDGGITSVETAVGDPRAVAPFFRIPGLLRSEPVETYLAAKSLAVWSTDEDADDWHHHISPAQIVHRAIKRIEANNHRGVLLLHDIHPATVMALPMLLQELKANGYHIVQAVPTGDRPKSVPEPETPAIAKTEGWPRLVKVSASPDDVAIKPVKTGHHHRRMGHVHRDPKSIAKKKHKPWTVFSGSDGWLGFWH
jgi:peptidoglycan/xylan/chitin deacetylase (PgdA/CDA1 family)